MFYIPLLVSLFLHFQEDERNFLMTSTADPGEIPDQATLKRLRDRKEHRRRHPSPAPSRPGSPQELSDDDDDRSAPGGPDDSRDLNLNLSLGSTSSTSGVTTRSQRGGGGAGGLGGGASRRPHSSDED